MITITEKAAGKIKDIFKAQGMPEGSCLRMGHQGRRVQRLQLYAGRGDRGRRG